MLLSLMVPLALVAFTIAIAPVLVMTVLSHIEQRNGPVRLPFGIGGTAVVPVSVDDTARPGDTGGPDDDAHDHEDDRHLARAA